MTNDEAKFLLNAYRPNGRDAADTRMAEALAQAKADPALAAWLAREQAHGAAVAAKLQELAPPPELREAILAGIRASKPTRARPRWRQPIWLAAAAAVTFLIAAASWWWAPVRGANLSEFAFNFVARGFLLQKRGADVAELKQWLAAHHAPLPAALPAEFAQLRSLGCRKLEFRGRDVSLICFERDGREFHLFVARRGDFPSDAASAEPRFFSQRKLVAAAWSDPANHYVVVSDADLAALKRVL